MKTYLTAAAVATIVLLGQWAQAQQAGYPPMSYYPQQGAYMAPGLAAPQQGISLAALQAGADAAAACGAAGCGIQGCDTGCSGCGCDPCCCIKWEVYGDFLYLRPRNAEVAFAVNTNLVVPPPAAPIQTGPVTLVDPDYEPGFRVGFRHYIDVCASVGVEYWRLESETAASATTNVTDVIQSLVTHPGSLTANTPWQNANATLDIDFDRVNVDYRLIVSCSDRHEAAFVGGAAYAGLTQQFLANFSVLGNEFVSTDVTFDGGGIRLGLEAERHALCSGMFVYGKGYATFIAGDFRTSYLQGNPGVDPIVVNTGWQAGRVVPILDLELGAGWASQSGCLRLSGGYLVSGWFNVVKTDEWIKAVQSNNFTGLSDTMSFDGLVARAEVRF
jgi:hypothetical protein